VCQVPGSLQDVHMRLIDADVMGIRWIGVPHLLFHDAGPEVAERLLAMDTDDSRQAVAWMADEAPREALVRRSHAEAAWPALVAGWAFGEDWAAGLYWPRSHRLQRGRSLAPVAAVVDGEERCGGCGDPMTTLLDVDLTDPRVAFLGDGRRLRIPTCERCVCWGTSYATVDTEGGATWSDASDRPTTIFDMGTPSGREPLGLGDERRRPFSGVAFDMWRSSQLGGVPLWVQNPDYPTCPACGGTMRYLGQVAWEDTGEDLAEGVIFAFWSRGCGIAATLYQQT